MAGEEKWTMAVRKGLLELFTSQELRTGSLTGTNQLNSPKFKLIEGDLICVSCQNGFQLSFNAWLSNNVMLLFSDVLHEWCNVKKTEYVTHKVFRTQVGNVIDGAKRPPADRRTKEEVSMILNIKN